jgi:pimeloyl-ACP methyl ester carboxylesterase
VRVRTTCRDDRLDGEVVLVPFVVVSSGVELCYESFGPSGAPLVVLVAGFGAQMLSWDPGLCAGLAERDLRVVRFDNRVGISPPLR